MEKSLVIGMDYGSDSVRAVLVDALSGDTVAESVFYYPRWKNGEFCEPEKNMFRQHPLDYIEGLETTIKDVIKKANLESVGSIKAIAVDTTGSTPCAVDSTGTPLALTKGFESNPNAMFVLWKDHTAIKEAGEINSVARSWGGTDYTKYVGGIYSSEWFWAKMLHVMREDDAVRTSAASWVEHCDWIPALLTGTKDVTKIYRSRCAAGHKGMWNEEFDGLPSEDFLVAIDPILKGVRKKLYRNTETAEKPVGTLCKEWADKLGLSEDVIIAGSAFDSHMGAAGGEIKEFDLVKVIGTSTCDILVAPNESVSGILVNGICGQVDGSAIPGMMGFEAGQSAFGDVYAWFKNLLLWPIKTFIDDEAQLEGIADRILYKLEDEASKLDVDPSLVAMDWFNGRRTPDADQRLKAAITGLNLSTSAPRIYRSLIEATAFGARAILDRFTEQGIKVSRVIAIGGVARKSVLGMQILSNIMNREILVSASDQAVALGSAMFASVAAGIHKNIEDAQKAMGAGFSATFKPQAEFREKYELMYQRYKKLGAFIEDECTGDDNE